MFAQVTYTQNPFCHVDFMEIVSFCLTTSSQPHLSLSVLLERPSVSTTWSNRSVRLFQIGCTKPLGTNIDRGSAVNHHQSILTFSAAILARGYVTDQVFNREHKLFSSLGVDVLDLDLIHHLVMVGSWPTVSCEVALLSAHVALSVVVRLLAAFAFALALAFAHVIHFYWI